jgi:hypothetical protein
MCSALAFLCFCATTGLASPEHRSILFRGADFALSGAVIFVV